MIIFIDIDFIYFVCARCNWLCVLKGNSHWSRLCANRINSYFIYLFLEQKECNVQWKLLQIPKQYKNKGVKRGSKPANNSRSKQKFTRQKHIKRKYLQRLLKLCVRRTRLCFRMECISEFRSVLNLQDDQLAALLFLSLFWFSFCWCARVYVLVFVLILVLCPSKISKFCFVYDSVP